LSTASSDEWPTWSDGETPDDMSDALLNIQWAINQMKAALDEGRYRFEAVHVRADLAYLGAETSRAIRQRAARPSPTPTTSGDTHA
jgi:hypothetical protein